MKSSVMLTGLLALWVLASGCSSDRNDYVGMKAEASTAPDVTDLESSDYTIEFENDLVRVLRAHYEPGDRWEPHAHPAGCGVVLDGGTFRFVLTSGEVVTGQTQSQTVNCTDAEIHSPENVGNGPAEFVFFDLKDRTTFDNELDPRHRGGVTSVDGIPDALAADPYHYSVEFENDEVRVLRARYRVGEASRMHSHPAICAIYLTGGSFRFTSETGEETFLQRDQGEVTCRPGGIHLPENVGAADADVIILEMKGRQDLDG